MVDVAREELGTRVPPTHPPRGAADPVAGGRGVYPPRRRPPAYQGPVGAETLLSVGPPPLPRDGRAHAVQPVQGPQDDRCEPPPDRLELSQGERSSAALYCALRYTRRRITLIICNANPNVVI